MLITFIRKYLCVICQIPNTDRKLRIHVQLSGPQGSHHNFYERTVIEYFEVNIE